MTVSELLEEIKKSIDALEGSAKTVEINKEYEEDLRSFHAYYMGEDPLYVFGAELKFKEMPSNLHFIVY